MLYEIYKQHPKISTDSRKIEPGAIFFALQGDKFDGNLHAQAALQAGAAYAVVDDASLCGDRFIHVPDVLQALQQLARTHREALAIPIIALTGSNGKTTTKEMLVRVLSTTYNCKATVGNLNNHIGVPLTILSFDPRTQIGVVEMGANHLHEIALLCSIAKPNVGLITNIGKAHLEGFGSHEGIRKGKGELYDYLSQNSGTAIYNTTDPILSEMVFERKNGLHTVGYDPSTEPLEIAMYGTYNQLNAQAAYAVGLHFGASQTDARRAIESYIPQNNRSQIVKTTQNTLYLDAYNANPSSMRVAIENFAALTSTPKTVIIGEMRELGNYSTQEHRALVELLANEKFEQVMLVGQNLEPFAADYLHFADVEQLSTHILAHPITNNQILIKGSRGVALERIIEYL